MPNNVNNYVTITVPKEQKDAFLEFVEKISYKNDITEGISYDKVIPCPKEYHIDQNKKKPYYDSSSTNDIALKDYTTHVLYGRAVPHGNKLADRIHTKQELAETIGKIMYENEQKYGAKDWYDWCYENWSTKWDAYDTEAEYAETRENLTYDWQFTSAWNPPYKVLEKLFKTIMEKFPNASIVTMSATSNGNGPPILMMKSINKQLPHFGAANNIPNTSNKTQNTLPIVARKRGDNL